MLLEAVSNRDYPLMQALFLFTTIGVLIANFLADLLLRRPGSAGARDGGGMTTSEHGAHRQSIAEVGRASTGRRGLRVPGWFVILWRNRKCRHRAC